MYMLYYLEQMFSNFLEQKEHLASVAELHPPSPPLPTLPQGESFPFSPPPLAETPETTSKAKWRSKITWSPETHHITHSGIVHISFGICAYNS
jgi:hypothetical protein